MQEKEMQSNVQKQQFELARDTEDGVVGGGGSTTTPTSKPTTTDNNEDVVEPTFFDKWGFFLWLAMFAVAMLTISQCS